MDPVSDTPGGKWLSSRFFIILFPGSALLLTKQRVTSVNTYNVPFPDDGSVWGEGGGWEAEPVHHLAQVLGPVG